MFGPPVTLVYNPLIYARGAHETYIRRFGAAPKKVLFLGMNPGPWGMVQTGVPFGEIDAVTSWMDIRRGVDPPSRQHPKRPVAGLACSRSEVSGRRFWGLARRRFGTPLRFFAGNYVGNYCPLAFLEASGRNKTPATLRAAEKTRLFGPCDTHLMAMIRALRPEWVIGIGAFAHERILAVVPHLAGHQPRIERILHPSPANPRANQGWEKLVLERLTTLKVW